MTQNQRRGPCRVAWQLLAAATGARLGSVSFALALGLASLAIGGSANATTIRYLDTQVGVDTQALIENPTTGFRREDDPAPRVVRGSTDMQALVVALEPEDDGVGVNVGTSLAIARGIILRLPSRVRFIEGVTASGHAEGPLTGVAFARSFGEATFQVEPEVALVPGQLLALQLSLEVDIYDTELFDPASFIDFSIVIDNVTTGATIFDSASEGLPPSMLIYGLHVGDDIRLRYDSQVFSPLSEMRIRGSFTVRGTIQGIVVPEPSSLALILAGGIALAAVRRPARGRVRQPR